MANKIMVNLYGKEVALADIARYTHTNADELRRYYHKHRDNIYGDEAVLSAFFNLKLSDRFIRGFFNESGDKIIGTPNEYLMDIVNKIYKQNNTKEYYISLRSQINTQCILISKQYGIDKATLKRYYTSNKRKAENLGIEWTMERAAQEILRKPQFMERLNNLGYVDSIIKSRIENIYNNNHLIKSNTELLNMIRQDRLCDIPLRKELRKRCAEEGIAETSILPMLNKYKHLSLDEILQGFKNKTLRRI